MLGFKLGLGFKSGLGFGKGIFGFKLGLGFGKGILGLGKGFSKGILGFPPVAASHAPPVPDRPQPVLAGLAPAPWPVSES